MNWSTLKLKALNALMAWLAGQVWQMAQDAVYVCVDRADLDGPAKLALARTLLLERARAAGQSLTASAANFLLEAAVQQAKTAAS